MHQPQHAQNNPEICSYHSARVEHIHLFFKIKEKLTCLTRQVLFTAIAIFDKFITNLTKKQLSFDEQSIVRVTVCLWIACKFIDTEKIPLKKLMEKTQLSNISIWCMIDMEEKILSGLNYQIPEDNAFASLIRYFEQKSKNCTTRVKLASQCLGFLRQGLDFSSDFSLCCELGPTIVILYMEQTATDKRIKEVYSAIQRKQQEKKNNSIAAI